MKSSAMNDFTKNTFRSLALILILLVVDRLPALTRGVGLGFIAREMHNGQLNADDYHALAGSYYEGIEQVDRISKNNVENDDFALRDDFLRFEFKPRLKRPTAIGMRITNSFGMANPEYGYERPTGVRRVAWLGDSIATGAYGYCFVQLLEERLNKDDRPAGVQSYQILNFSVPGYVLPQKMYVAIEKAPKFHPDVYVIQLDSQEIIGQRKHIARLLERGVDLKYDFLKQIVRQAGIRPDDDVQRMIVRLKPFSTQLTQWFIKEIKDNADKQGARVIVALIPVVIDPEVTAADFDSLHQAIDGMGLPIVDVRDTFRNRRLQDLQVIPDADIHPNIEGHRMIFEDLYTKLHANSQAFAALTGAPAR